MATRAPARFRRSRDQAANVIRVDLVARRWCIIYDGSRGRANRTARLGGPLDQSAALRPVACTPFVIIDMSKMPRSTSWLASNPYLLLLVSIVATLLLAPWMQDRVLGRILMQACFTMVFVVGVFSNWDRPLVFRTAIAIAIAAVLLGWGGIFTQTPQVSFAGIVTDLIFFAYLAVIILVAVMRNSFDRIQALFGAICAYLLVGLAWALAYAALESVDAESFQYIRRLESDIQIGSSHMTALSQLVYFSFVTMSTLGYGDIIPLTHEAQTLAWMQAVTGQLFLAVLVAKLVSELPQTRHTK